MNFRHCFGCCWVQFWPLIPVGHLLSRNSLQTGLLSSGSADDWVRVLFWVCWSSTEGESSSLESSSELCTCCWVLEVELSFTWFSSVASVDAKSVSAMKMSESHNVSLFILVKRHRWSFVPFHVSFDRHSLILTSLQCRRSWSSEQCSILAILLRLGGTWYFVEVRRYLVDNLHYCVDPPA